MSPVAWFELTFKGLKVLLVCDKSSNVWNFALTSLLGKIRLNDRTMVEDPVDEKLESRYLV